jgi:hypothetical protein
VLQFTSGRARIEEAVPGAEVVAIRLRAPLDVVLERIEAREAGDPTWFRDAASYLVPWMEENDVADFVVENDGRAPADTAREALTLAGWL